MTKDTQHKGVKPITEGFTEPNSTLSIYQKTLVFIRVGLRGKRRNPIRGVNNNNVTLLNLSGSSPVKVCRRDVGAGSNSVLKVHINSPSQESGQRKVCHAGPVIIMVVGALTVGSQMAGQIHDCVEIRDGAAGAG